MGWSGNVGGKEQAKKSAPAARPERRKTRTMRGVDQSLDMMPLMRTQASARAFLLGSVASAASPERMKP